MLPERGPAVAVRDRWSVPVPGTRLRLGVGLLAVVAALAASAARNTTRGDLGGLAMTDVAVAAGFVLSVLVHEGAHAMAARRLGYRVDWVVLGLLGGQTAYSGRADRPLDRAAIAMAGPATSAAAVIGLAAVSVGTTPGEGPLGGAVSTVLWFNVATFLANLVPVPVPGSDGWHVVAGLAADRQGAGA